MSTTKIEEQLKERIRKELQLKVDEILHVLTALDSMTSNHEYSYKAPKVHPDLIREEMYHYGKIPEVGYAGKLGFKLWLGTMIQETYGPKMLEIKTKALLDKLDLTNV